MSDSVDEWVMTIKMATDDNSPFAGMVDLTPIFKEPIETQHKIFNQLSEETKSKLQSLYGEE